MMKNVTNGVIVRSPFYIYTVDICWDICKGCEEMKRKSGVLKLYSEVKSVPVEWLWYPYIPSGKITLLQGDPGDGKSTMMMNLISCLTNAEFTPNGQKISVPKRVIYQCSEDGVEDTIKPRLEASGADCSRVAFIDEELITLTLDDEKLRDAIIEFKANLVVIDPFQAYLGDDIDITNAKKIRKVMQRLNIWASTYNCAIVLIGHMTKKENQRDLYRGLGSIDLVAAARSVLQVYRVDDDSTARYVKHIKSSLAPKGEDFGFDLDAKTGFQWLGTSEEFGEATWSEMISSGDAKAQSKDEMIAGLLKEKLIDGPIKATEIQSAFVEMGISIKSLKRVKKIIGIKSIRKQGQWFWAMADVKEDE